MFACYKCENGPCKDCAEKNQQLAQDLGAEEFMNKEPKTGHHINKDGQFQSDKYPDLKPDKIALSFKDKHAKEALRLYAELTKDTELAKDILFRLDSMEKEPKLDKVINEFLKSPYFNEEWESIYNKLKENLKSFISDNYYPKKESVLKSDIEKAVEEEIKEWNSATISTIRIVKEALKDLKKKLGL